MLIITGLFFFSAGSAMAENQAGDSAQLSLSVKIAKEEQRAQNLKRKELAIKSVLNRYDSPMADDANSFVEACIKYNLDCYLLPSIAGLESTFGRFIWPNSYNPFGWGRGFIMFDSWEDGIDAVGKGLRKEYLDRGALSIQDIGPIYSESPTWAIRVQYFVNEFQREEAKLQLYLNQMLGWLIFVSQAYN